MTALMRNGRNRRSGKPVTSATRYLSARFWLGPDQRITSGPAATAAASRRGKPLREKQAAYMAAPERFAERSDSSCTAGTLHTWPLGDQECGPLALTKSPLKASAVCNS